jgi:choline dehydrogenase
VADAVGDEVDWGYETTPQTGGAGQVHQWPRGKVLGGSSSLNGMVYPRGNPADFDDWAYHGCRACDYDALLPLFRRMEDVPDGDPHHRGRGGPNTPARRPTPTRSPPRSSSPRAGPPTRSRTTTTAPSSRAPAPRT